MWKRNDIRIASFYINDKRIKGKLNYKSKGETK